MSELPGTIHIKRKLVEDPPETLYIEHEGHGFEAGNVHARPVYRLIQAAKRPRTGRTDSVSSSQHSWQTNTTQRPASKDRADQPLRVPIIETSTATSDDHQDILVSSRIKTAAGPRPKRVFHLSAARAMSLSRVPSSSSLRGNLRRRGKHSSVAVFAEKRALRVDQMARSIANSRPDTPTALVHPGESSCKEVKPRKRPSTRDLVSVKDKKSLMADLNMPGQGQSSEADLELAAELQQFAFETSPPTKEPPPLPRIDVTQSARHKPIKYQPRPPPERNVPKAIEISAIPTSISRTASGTSSLALEDSTEWVYDIYVRDIATSSKQMLDIESSGTQATSIDSEGNVGYIVIRAEDEQAWEEFLSDQEDSDFEWDDGDQDSNAEDHYGNDYPDELDSDDEWALGKASDEEYSDSDYYNHSNGQEK